MRIDGVHISELNLSLLRDHQHPAAPTTRDYTVSIPGMHGAHDFGADLGPRPFNLPMRVRSKNENESLPADIRKMASAFIDPYGKPKTIQIIFDYEPDKFYMARYSGSIPIDRYFSMGKFELPMVAFDPHAYSITESTDDVLWGDDIPFMSDIPLGIVPSQYLITSPQDINIDNFGMQVVRPIVEIAGSATSLTLTINGESFYFGNFTNASFLIDAERYVAMKDGQNFLSQLQGNLEKLELIPDANEVIIDGSNLNIDIAFKYRAKYI